MKEVVSGKLSLTAAQARNMYDGHHLGKPLGGGEEDFSYWRGPVVEPDMQASEQQQRAQQGVVNEFQQALRRSFTSTNFVKEVLTREIASCTTSMSWLTTEAADQTTLPDNGDKTVLEERADKLLDLWWKSANNHVEKAIREGLHFARREGRGVLRFRVAGRALSKGADGVLRVRSDLGPEQLAKYVRLECVPKPENVFLWEDSDTFLKSAVYAYTDARGNECAEICYCSEPEGPTRLRVLRAGQEAAKPIELELGERLLYIELKASALISRQFLQNQMAYNTASTMILRNTELAGFLERYGINIEPPFEEIIDPVTGKVTGKKYLPAKPGAGTMVAWAQMTTEHEDKDGNYLGEKPLGTAQYGRFEPSSPDALVMATTHNQLNMYSEAGQTFVLMGKDATASGRSREVAISDFDNTRQETIDLAESVIGEVNETFLALVAALASQPQLFEHISVEGQVKRSIVPPSSEDRKADRDDVAAGIISKQTARQRQSIDNSDGEEAQIEKERAALPSSDKLPTSTATKTEPVTKVPVVRKGKGRKT